MTVLARVTKVSNEVGPNSSSQPHITSSASQSASPQFLHLASSPTAQVEALVHKLIAGAWVLVGAFFLGGSDPGIPVGGLNAPIFVSLVTAPSMPIAFEIRDSP